MSTADRYTPSGSLARSVTGSGSCGYRRYGCRTCGTVGVARARSGGASEGGPGAAGHANISITMDVQGHMSPDLHRQAAEQLAALIFPGWREPWLANGWQSSADRPCRPVN